MGGINLRKAERANHLLLAGARALSKVESTGIRVDLAYLDSAIKKTEKSIRSRRAALMESDVGLEWRKHFGAGFNFNAREQLGEVIVSVLDVRLPTTSRSGQYKTDDATLEPVARKHEFVAEYLKIARLAKALSTYLYGIRRQAVDGIIHPFFNLHNVTTYRSSCDSPNFQNIPKRDKDIKKLIRRVFIPRKGRVLIETDYSSLEVRVAACYNRDPMLINYIKDPTTDMHRDMACECFRLPIEEVSPAIRYAVKSFFVFAQFYGDWYVSCAQRLWKAANEGLSMVTADEPLIDHLRSIGLTKLGDRDNRAADCFTYHIKQVEDRFWKDRFKVYAAWKRRWFEDYCERGWLQMLSGFVVRGVLGRKEVINYPIQGAAFHCLLRSLCEMVLREVPKRGLEARAVGQIHDSILGDVPVGEIEDYKSMMKEIMVDRLLKAWKWIIVPLAIEFDEYPESWATAA